MTVSGVHAASCLAASEKPASDKHGLRHATPSTRGSGGGGGGGGWLLSIPRCWNKYRRRSLALSIRCAAFSGFALVVDSRAAWIHFEKMASIFARFFLFRPDSPRASRQRRRSHATPPPFPPVPHSFVAPEGTNDATDALSFSLPITRCAASTKSARRVVNLHSEVPRRFRPRACLVCSTDPATDLIRCSLETLLKRITYSSLSGSRLLVYK